MKDATLKERVLAFKTFSLPGQPVSCHMGTSYLVNDLWQEIERLTAYNGLAHSDQEPFAWACGQNVRFEKPVEGTEIYFTALYIEPLKRVPTAWRSKENYSPDVGIWYEYYDAFREVNDTTGLTPLYE